MSEDQSKVEVVEKDTINRSEAKVEECSSDKPIMKEQKKKSKFILTSF